jgi:hypothetical protein
MGLSISNVHHGSFGDEKGQGKSVRYHCQILPLLIEHQTKIGLLKNLNPHECRELTTNCESLKPIAHKQVAKAITIILSPHPETGSCSPSQGERAETGSCSLFQGLHILKAHSL